MPPSKTQAFVLRVLPFRETSYILYLFSALHGMIHVVAKGLRSGKKGGTFVERGNLIETQVYFKAERDLHTAGAVQIVNHFPSVRSDIVKPAIRDAAFEALMSGVTVSDPHPELFELISRFSESLEERKARDAYPLLLWRFYLRFASMMGFELDLNRCVTCGADCTSMDAWFKLAHGGFQCGKCSKAHSHSTQITPDVRKALSPGKVDRESILGELSKSEKRRITRLLADYLRYHLERQEEYRSLDFLDQII